MRNKLEFTLVPFNATHSHRELLVSNSTTYKCLQENSLFSAMIMRNAFEITKSNKTKKCIERKAAMQVNYQF